MILKNLLAALAIVAASVSVPAVAQEVDREQAAEAMQDFVAQARDRLKLTDEQKPLVEEILKESAERRKAVMDKYGVSEGEKPNLNLRQMRSLRGDMQSVQEDTLNRMSEVLTPEQLEEFKKIQEEFRQEMRERLRSR